VFILVAVPVPALDLLTYEVPHDLVTPAIGARVVVPLGSRSVTGIVVGLDVSAADLKGLDVKAVRRVLDAEAFVPADVVELARWTAEYYGAGAGETITAVLPPKARDERADAHKTRRVAAITAAGTDALGVGTPKQREVLAVLSAEADGVSTARLAARGISSDTVTRLARAGLVSLRQERVNRDPFQSNAMTGAESQPVRLLTDEQQRALARLTRLAATGTFRAALLHGVTGSGKTEIYLRLSEAVRSARRRVVILVPEIALTPAMVAVFRQAFGDRVAVQHSGLSDGERHDQWQKIRRGDVDVVVGTRSAIFAPVADLGLVIVDEEHDTSYKQEESPRYNGRDVAIVRAQRAKALVVLGSATPSMETYHNAATGRFERIVLERRVHDRPLASVRVIDMREEYAAEGADVILSRALREAVALRIVRAEQSLILLNRRGFATAVFCRQCAGSIDCPNCSVSLVIHGEGAARRARCHYCNYSVRVPQTCPACAAPYMEQSGFGTERVESEVKRLNPTARVARLDRDAVRRKGSLTEILSKFADGKIDVLVGTQMIAKGHDFPRVTLVGVVSADVGLGMADFRASERTFQILTQVAGRAGRGERIGEAIVQTMYPNHYAVQLACRQDYRSFYDRELAFRKAMRYPPEVSLVNAVVRARTYAQAMDDGAHLARWMREEPATPGDLRVLGPAPAPLGKLRGEYRVQLLLKGSNRKRMREALMSVLARRPELARRTTVDVDPLSVL
jgi:primosomal protein N' (replication factor Y) (superfamily II helicase)